MPVSDRLSGSKAHEASGLTAPGSFMPGTELGALARRYRDRLVGEANLEELVSLPAQIRRTRVESLVASMVRADGLTLGQAERDHLVRFIVNEVVGRGPLERLFADETITEIMVNGPDRVYVEQNGRIIPREDIRFADEAHILHIIDRIVSPLGRRVDESNPMVDARTPEGDRINAVIPPLSLNGPVLTIRRFHKGFLSGEALVRNGTLTQDMLDFLRACTAARLNTLVSGGTGSGKTTLLNILASNIPPEQRIVTIEDSAELQFHRQHPHVVRLESRPANVEGKGDIPIRELVRNALRMRPDRIVVGEVRGAEAMDMLQAMNTGHEGSMTTVHANSPREAFSRLETMVMWAEGASQLPLDAIREHLVSALDIVIQQERLPDGRRRIVEISEVQGVRKGHIVLKPVFVYERHGVDEKSGEVLGTFSPTGHVPRCLSRMRAAGVDYIDPAIFQPEYLMAELGVSLLENDAVTEIMINGPDEVYVEQSGKLERRSDLHFRDEQHVRSVMDAIIAPLGRRLDESHPMVDARLPDGSRINALLPPIALNGPVLTIRRFPQHRLSVEELVAAGTLTEQAATYLRACVHCRLNILVSGGTGSGKTTLLNVLSRYIPIGERVVTIEDVAELQLQQPHVIRMEARPEDEYGEGAISIRDLVRNALRMRPDRIIVGEVRGAEALDMLQAMNTGHPGSMTTIHANGVRDAFARLQTMILWAEAGLQETSVRDQIGATIDVVVQVERAPDGGRRVVEVAEVQGMEFGQIVNAPVFEFHRARVRADGRVDGVLKASRQPTRHMPRFRDSGIDLTDIWQEQGAG